MHIVQNAALVWKTLIVICDYYGHKHHQVYCPDVFRWTH